MTDEPRSLAGTVPDEAGRPVPDPAVGVVRAAPPSTPGLLLVLGVALLTLAALVGVAVLVSRTQG
jgi:hypothetical protein